MMGADKHALLLESLRVLKKGCVVFLHDSMRPQMYGDMNAFVEKLMGMGFAEVWYVETAETIFGSNCYDDAGQLRHARRTKVMLSTGRIMVVEI